MSEAMSRYFEYYSSHQAPFMHQQLVEWRNTRPLAGLNVLHNVPLVPNTLLKISCLVAAGANVVVTNPSFLEAHPKAIQALNDDKICYVKDVTALNASDFDIYFDCCGELHQKLGAPNIGAIELTATGDHYYRQQQLSFPVISIDKTLTKQIETIFGSGDSVNKAITQLTNIDVTKKSWVVFGFGKIGRGIAYFCVENNIPIVVVDSNEQARMSAEKFGIKTVSSDDYEQLKIVLDKTDIVVTSTGMANVIGRYPKEWFANKILANMGVNDEFGANYTADEVLNKKLPVNFILDDPTPIECIDPELYAHNVVVFELLKKKLAPGVSDMSKALDNEIVKKWCDYHGHEVDSMTEWFIKM